MAYDKPLKMQWTEINGRAVPLVLPQYWSDEQNDWVVSSEQNRLPVDAQLTGSNVEDDQRIPTKPVYIQTEVLRYPTPTNILAGSSIQFNVTTALKGAKEITIGIVEISQTYTIKVNSRPVGGVTYVVDEVAKDQPVVGSYTSKRHTYTVPSPLFSYQVNIEIFNTSSTDATIKGLYVIGR